MDTDNHRSTIVPIAVTLQSEQEQSKGAGTFTAHDDGFTLEFALGDGSYTVTNRDGEVMLSVGGVLSYSIDFSCGGELKLSTPFGVISYTVEPKNVQVKTDERGVQMDLRYALIGGAERLERAVNISATFLK